MVGLLAASSLFAILSGLLDIAYPSLTGQPRFMDLYLLAARFGPAYLFFHIFLHNFGMAAIVPGVGIVASSFEADRRRRRWIAWILAGAVVVSLGSAAELILLKGWEQMTLVVPLLFAESSAVLLLTYAGLRALRSFVPTPNPQWAWFQPARELTPYIAISATALAFSALVETIYLWKTMGW